MTPWPCDTCGAAGMRNLGSKGYCGRHLTELYAKFDQRVFAYRGVGYQAGPERPDWGPQHADLECCSCGASWTGIIGEQCWWCTRAHYVLLEHSAAVVLTPPDIDQADRHYVATMKAWGHRLANAVTAGVITQQMANSAWRLAIGEAAA